MNSIGRASAKIFTTGYDLGGVRMVVLATCLGWIWSCSGDEATPQVPLDPPNRGSKTAGVDESTEQGGSGSDSGGSGDSQGGNNTDNADNQGGVDSGSDEGQGGSSESPGSTSSGGTTEATSTSKSTGTTPAAGSSCIQGVDTGDACDPEIDTAVCERSTRDCTCGDDSTWTCTPKGAMGTGTSP